MRSAILLGAFFIGHSLTHIKPEVLGAIIPVLLFAFCWDAVDSLANWRS